MKSYEPLASRMRPNKIDDIFGQDKLIAKGQSIHSICTLKQMHSLVLWGAPGTGKTTLAYVIAKCINAKLITISAVNSGVKEIRDAISEFSALHGTLIEHEINILFIDEIHRFNKAQQDALLPYVESGKFFLIGATTENPSFSINNSLLSRLQVYILENINEEAMGCILSRAIKDTEKGLGKENLKIDDNARKMLISFCDGDARYMLNLLEICSNKIKNEKHKNITVELIKIVAKQAMRRFDKHGDHFYDQISALHKSIRGSNPDGALYWFARMLDGGVDPLYIARRLIKIASEDIGNADPRALSISMDAWQAMERLGSPEGELSLAQAVIYLSVAAKSNAVYNAFNKAKEFVKNNGSLPVPIHLRNAPTTLMKEIGFGTKYRYSHNEPNAYAAGETYFPEGIKEQEFYCPTSRGMEKQINEKMQYLKELDTKYKQNEE